MDKLGRMDILLNQLWTRLKVSLTWAQCRVTMLWE